MLTTPKYLVHNSDAINEQNIFCDGKSAWEIMREHDDFKDGKSYANKQRLIYPASIPLRQQCTYWLQIARAPAYLSIQLANRVFFLSILKASVFGVTF